MGCGQSKINLYPRRNKAGSKQGSKKSASSDSKDGDEDETQGSAERTATGTGGSSPGSNDQNKDTHNDVPKAPAPPQHHSLGRATSSTEISASQVDFFKMLDDKIDKGKEYDSSSETEIQLEHQRISSLLSQWESASSQYNHPSPPTPSKRKMGFQDRQNSKQSSIDKPRSPDIRRCIKNQPPAPVSPPRRCQHPYQQDIPDIPAGVPQQQQVWKPPVPYPVQKLPSQKSFEDDSRSYSPGLLTQREICQSYGVTSEYIERDSSQITYNPTFQSHSPAHKPAAIGVGVGVVQPQPYIAQIITYPMSQQGVAYHNAQKYIAQPGITYQQQQTMQRYPGRAQQEAPPVQPNIYYIAPPAMIAPPQVQEPGLTAKQQTALHLQQYVAMKQAQQAMAFGTQRMPGGQMVHDFGNYCVSSGDSQPGFARKMYERQEEGYSMNYMTLGRAPNAPKGTNPAMFSQQRITVGGFQNRPGCTASLGRNQTFNLQKNSDQTGLAQSIPIQSPMNAVRSVNTVNIAGVQKAVGQIVSLGASQDGDGDGEPKQKQQQHLGSNIVGRQMYYSQVVSSQSQAAAAADPCSSSNVKIDNGSVWKLQGKSNSVESTGSQEYL